MSELITSLEAGNLKIDNPLMHKTEEIERICLIVIGSDRGLCGAFNNNLFKTIEATIAARYRKYQRSGKLEIIADGRKAEAYFNKRNYREDTTYRGFFDMICYEL